MPPGRFSVRLVLRRSLDIFGRDWHRLLVLAAAIEVPLVAAEVLLHVTPSIRGVTEDESLAGLVALLTLYGSLSHHFLAGLLERVVGAHRQGAPRPTLRAVVRHLPWTRLIVADLVLTAMILAGLALLVVPGLVIATWFALALPIINLEDRGVLASFGRSRALVRGHFWRVAIIATGAFVVPEAVVGAVAVAAHTGNAAIDLVLHAIPATVVLPLAALPIVIAAFDLVDLDAARPPAVEASGQARP